MQKTYIPNFLDHISVKNNGEVEKIYIDDHHEPIVDKGQWQLVQHELERRHNKGIRYINKNMFLSKIICSECGGSYGKKI